MEEKTKVFEVRKTFTRTEEDKERIIFQFNDAVDKWEYFAPNQQVHSEGQLKIIYEKLKELNRTSSEGK